VAFRGPNGQSRWDYPSELVPFESARAKSNGRC
jgi:hypothetical protein